MSFKVSSQCRVGNTEVKSSVNKKSFFVYVATHQNKNQVIGIS